MHVAMQDSPATLTLPRKRRREFRVPARGSVNPSPLGDGSLFLASPSGIPWRSPEGEGWCLMSATGPTLTGLSRNPKPSPLGEGSSLP